MRINSIVVGVGFGDEGKGRVVDALCDNYSTVVRFSGGQQAGHTVIRNGIKHIFSSFGAGTLKGCPTFFTEDTCIYPKTINSEWEVLKDKGIEGKLWVDPYAKVTTPWDVWAGRGRELAEKHGSCGLGIGATMKRNESPVKLYALDLFAPRPYLEQRLAAIARFYEGVEPSQDDIDLFWQGVTNKKFELRNWREIYSDWKHFVFEGSQGILLDMDHGIFPHVTYANTTSKNALKYLKGSVVDIAYVSRCYSTRHGNGWFDKDPISLINNEEEINKLNPWQGEFKVGEFDYDLLNWAITVDSSYHSLNKSLVITCMDQRPDFKLIRANLNHTFKGIYGSNSPHSESHIYSDGASPYFGRVDYFEQKQFVA